MSTDVARDYFKFLIEKVEISRLAIPEDADPNMIFEVLNFRGKPLSSFDLIRNHFYSFFNSPSESERRGTIRQKLDEILPHQLIVGNSNKVLDYAQCYLRCEHGFLREKQFYRDVRDKIQNDIANMPPKKRADYIFKLIGRLTDERCLQLFSTIARPETNNEFIDLFNKDALQTGKKRNLKILLDELRDYTVTQPILFALLSRYVLLEHPSSNDKKKMAKVIYRKIKTINAFVMRTVLVERKFEPSKFEKGLSDIAHKVLRVRNIEKLSAINVLDSLRNLAAGGVTDVTNDKKFIQSLERLELPHKNKPLLVLLSINSNSQSDNEVVATNNASVEHILPKGATHWSEWKGFENEHDDYINRLGNLTLLGKSDNKPSANYNKNWRSKKPILLKSIFSINQYFKNISKWTPQEIDKRQKKLARLIAEIWAF